MTFYIENKLSDKLLRHIQNHLNNCPACKENYNNLKMILNNISGVRAEMLQDEEDEFEARFITKQYEDFKSNLSAYVDNELNDSENIRIKKIAISNPIARQDLEDIFMFKRLLHTSFEKTKTDAGTDFSKHVLNHVYGIRHGTDPFLKIVLIFTGMIVSIIAACIWCL